MMLPDHFQVGDLRVDLGLHRVRRGDHDIPLPKLSYEVLLALARAAPNLLSTDELMSEVWAGVVVNAETVGQRIKLLRDALGDDPRSPRYIAGLRGRGYRLIPPVVAVELESLPIGELPVALPRRVRPWLIVVGLSFLAIGLIAWYGVGKWHSMRAVDSDAYRSIAVLPFLDMSEKKDHEYFSDGLTEELIDALARVPDLRVPARTSSFYFKSRPATIPQIASSLDVRYVLEGSVRASGKILRVTVQLIRVDNGYHVWSKTYDRPIDDLFTVQDEIAAAVVEELKASLLPNFPAHSVPTKNRDAYDLYLQARALFHNGQLADHDVAYDLLLRAVTLDPGFAEAWSDMAKVRVRQFRVGLIPLDKARAEAHAAVNKALQLAPSLAEAHMSLGRVCYVLDWQWQQARAEIHRAMELDDGVEDTYQWAGMIEQVLGNSEGAMRYYEKQRARDPMAPHAYDLMARVNYRAGNWEGARRGWARAHELWPWMYGESYNAKIYLAQGQPAAALTELIHVSPDQAHTLKAQAFFALGRRQEADAELAILEREHALDSPAVLAMLHAQRNEADATFEWLERAYAAHDIDLTFIRGEPAFKNVEEDPRFHAFLEKFGVL